MKKKILCLLVIVNALTLVVSSLAADPLGRAFTYQGRLNEGSVAANGSYDLRFTLYDEASGGMAVAGPLTNSAVGVANGLFTVSLDFGPSAFDGDARWLEISVRTNAVGDFVILTPRQPITSAPYALHAGSVSAPLALIAEGAPGTAVLSVGSTGAGVAIGASSTNGDIAVLGKTNTAVWGISPNGFAGYFDGKGYFSGNVGIGTSTPQSALHVAGTVTAGAFSGSGAGLTGVSEALADGSISSSKIADGTITDADVSSISGAKIIGGDLRAERLMVGSLQTVTGANATIAGGAGCTASGDYSAIGGGYYNNIAGSSSYTIIAGGFANDIGTNAIYSAIVGGYNNNIADNTGSSTIAGGGANDIGTNSTYGVISGGYDNDIADNAFAATIAGGAWNSIGTNSPYSATGGGKDNLIADNSPYATIAGGSDNTATNYAFAAGRRAKANHTGAFVWGDGTDDNVASTNANAVTMRASGGYRLFSNAGLTAGVFLAGGGGSWTSLSDRNAKENFRPIDALEVLDKVTVLPVSTWNYKSQDAGVRHIGAVAQDFKAAFGLGEADTGISTVDADGVALAAIQGLNQKVESGMQRSNIQIGELKAENAALKARLEKLERWVEQEVNGGVK